MPIGIRWFGSLFFRSRCHRRHRSLYGKEKTQSHGQSVTTRALLSQRELTRLSGPELYQHEPDKGGSIYGQSDYEDLGNFRDAD